MIPTFEARAGVFTLTWPDAGLLARVERLSESSRGELTGLVTFKTQAGDVSEHLHQARLNMLSTRSRGDCAKYLTSRVNGRDWDAILEQLCVLTSRKYYEGEPIVKVGTAEPQTAEVRYRIAPLVQEKQPTLFYGLGGNGKSLLATWLALLVELDYSGNIEGFAVKRGHCLFCDWETDDRELNDRIWALKKGMGILVDPNLPGYTTSLDYLHCSQPLPGMVDMLQRRVAEEHYDLIVVDSVGAACGGEPENAGVCLGFFNAIRSLGVTPVLIGHKTKDSQSKYPFGSIYWWNESRSIFEVRGQEEANVISLGLFHQKNNNGPKLPAMGFRICFGDTGQITVASAKVRDTPELNEGLSVVELVKEILTHGALTIDEIWAQLPEGKTTRESLKSMISQRKNVFTKTGNNAWGLVYHES